MRHHDLVISLYQIGAIQFGEFKLKSGQTSSIYINLRKIISYPTLLRTIAAAIWEKTQQERFDLVCGVPYTALPIATCLSLDYHIPMIMRRKEKKSYGTKQMVEGVFQPGQRCLVVEDIVTTGSSIIETTADLKELGLEVNDVVALIDREQGGKANLEQHYRFHSILSLSTILQTLIEEPTVKEEERHLIKQFLLARSA